MTTDPTELSLWFLLVVCDRFSTTILEPLVIHGLILCEFAYSHFKIGQKWTFNLRIQDSRS